MNQLNKKKLSITTLAIILVAIAASIYVLSGNLQTNSLKLPQGNPPTAEVKLAGDSSTQKVLTVNDLAKMPLTNITINNQEETATFLGVSILTLLNQTSASWDVGNLNICGTNQQCTISTYQALNSTYYNGNEFILAFAKSGQWLTTQTGGPVQFIAPGLDSSYNVKSVNQINFEPWTVTVNGKLAHPLTLTGKNVSDFEVKTVEAEFAPGGEPQRISNWTGVTLQSILDAAGVNSEASKVTVTAIDGYSKQFTLAQVQSTGMMLGFQENGGYLSPDGGQPFRLMIPTEEFKWGQYWVRWVSEITIT
jgi:DMSO/TMAO reductase YedYZ molybdopterin-dependent catalytic subunit